MLILAVAVAIASGLILYIVEPNIHSLFDGIWSAWGTMNLVGFGDVVPTSFWAFADSFADFDRIDSVLTVYSNIVSDANRQKHGYIGA